MSNAADEKKTIFFSNISSIQKNIVRLNIVPNYQIFILL